MTRNIKHITLFLLFLVLSSIILFQYFVRTPIERPLSKATRQLVNQTTPPLDNTTIRCRAKYLGCFVPIRPPDSTYRPLDLDNTKERDIKTSCLDKCSKSHGLYAGVNIRYHTCICGDKIEGLLWCRKKSILVEHSWDLAFKCKSFESYKIYKILSGCQKDFNELSVNEDLIGCLETLPETKEAMISMTEWSNTVEECILNCENLGLTIAIPLQTKKTCICSDFISLFTNAENMKMILKQCASKGKDDRIPVYRTIVEDPACSARFYDISEADPVALWSLPGSGNTWIRHLIEVSTGVYTGSQYTDNALIEGGFLGETSSSLSGRSIAVKEHNISPPGKYKTIIYLIRNPYKATIAEWARRSTSSHTGLMSETDLNTTEFLTYAKGVPDKWLSGVKKFLDLAKRNHIVFYENLQQDQVKEMRRIADFLDLKSPDHKEHFESRLICMQLNAIGNFKRPSRNLSIDPFPKTMKQRFDDGILEMDRILHNHKFTSIVKSYLSTTSNSIHDSNVRLGKDTKS